MPETPAILFVGLALAWVVQLALSSWQMKGYYARLRELRQYGTVAVGMAGSAWRRRVYVLLAVDEQDRVVRADLLSGWTVFARPRPVPVLRGRTVQEILQGQVSGVSAKELRALQQAAEFLQRRQVEEVVR